ncbi:glycosyltransferase family 2 protein [Dyadobacter flavalbus]|uniref:Glycosyltransferase family 2 protein n=1 Tax=Dyadobacter flavalbus TaxID=2579942 RepID=A0A5M8QSA1_9BACT|nr:glycosyltransferase family 92 protein [Dyadobacter flavalbus]KAA6439137.1 glycosyltransferase family 2 protein [Dyadobacter flavalbus]
MFYKTHYIREIVKCLFTFKFWLKYKLTVCCIVKDENEYIEEWINYHRKIGVQHFYIYDNGSKKPVKQSLIEAGLSDYVTVSSIFGEIKQLEAYNKCLKKFGRFSQWMAFINVDEFIVPKSTKGNLVELLKDYEQFGGLGINWLVFGSSGHLNKSNKPVLERFQLRAAYDFHTNRHIKCIVQPKFVIHAVSPHAFFFKENYYCVNEYYKIIPDSFIDVSVNKIQLNHYFCKSLEEYHFKLERGRADTGHKRSIQEFYNHDREANAERDESILRIWDPNSILNLNSISS